MPHRVAAFTLAVLSALVFAGCGGENTSNSGGATEPSSATPTSADASSSVASTPADDETKIRAVSAGFVEAWNAKDWAGVCARLSPDAQAQAVKSLAAGGADTDTCEKAIESSSEATGAEQIQISITSVNITADKAVAPGATVGADGSTQDTHFERVDGEWFIGSGSEG